MFAYCQNNPVNMLDEGGTLPKWLSGTLNIVSGVLQMTAGAAIGIAAGWTGVGAVAAGVLLVNGAATVTQGTGQVVNYVTQTNAMREDNVIRSGVQQIGYAAAGNTGAKVAGAAYDLGVWAAACYSPPVNVPSVTLPQPSHTTGLCSPEKVSNPRGSYVKLDYRGNIYSYAQYDALGRQTMRIDFQGRSHGGVLPHIHLFVYPEQGGRAEYVFDLAWNLINK